MVTSLYEHSQIGNHLGPGTTRYPRRSDLEDPLLRALSRNCYCGCPPTKDGFSLPTMICGNDERRLLPSDRRGLSERPSLSSRYFVNFVFREGLTLLHGIADSR